jgi:hypothetical protein
MNALWKVVVCQCLSLLLRPLAQAAASDFSGNPYHEISDTNVFHLKPPAVATPSQPRPPLPKVTLTGITTMLPDKRALLLVQFPPHPPEPARQERYILAEGQHAGPVEVLEIDERSGRVKLLVSGEPMSLTFEASRP